MQTVEETRGHGWDLGLFAASVSQLTPAQTAALMAEQGYRWVEWRVETLHAIESSPWGRAYNTLPLDSLAADAKEVAPILAGHGVRTCALQVDCPPDWAAAPAVVLEAAQVLGCSAIGLAAPHYDPAVGQRAARDVFRSRIAEWVRAFEGSGVRLCVENHMWTIAPSTALVMDLLAPFAPTQVGVLWDPANSIWEGSETPTMALDLLGSYLAEAHLKNGAWARNAEGRWAFDWSDLEDGQVDWAQVLGLLMGCGYRGPLIVEDYRMAEPVAKLERARRGLAAAVAAQVQA